MEWLIKSNAYVVHHESAIYVVNRKDQKKILNVDSKILLFIREFFFF